MDRRLRAEIPQAQPQPAPATGRTATLDDHAAILPLLPLLGGDYRLPNTSVSPMLRGGTDPRE
jgi:hypothetical protein